MAVPGVARPGARRGGGRQVAGTQGFVCIRERGPPFCGSAELVTPPSLPGTLTAGALRCRACLRPAALQRASWRSGLQRLHPK